MNNFFSFNRDSESWAPYTGSVDITGNTFKPSTPQDVTTREAVQQAVSQPAPMMNSQPAPTASNLNGLAQLGLDAAKKLIDGYKPDTPESLVDGPHYPDTPGYTGADPWDVNHYEGTLTGNLPEYNNPVWDPSNYEGTLTGGSTGNPVFDPDRYSGTLYDQSNPLGLSEDQWVNMMGAMNSGSLAQEGLNTGLNLSDMGGVGDEIASQGGMMGDTLGNAAAAAGLIKGVYGLTQGSGGKGGADLAASVGAYFVPGFGWVKAAFDTGMGVAQYIRDQGRQYDYFHPYLNNQIMSADGSRVMNVGFEDNQGDALNNQMNNGSFVSPVDQLAEIIPGTYQNQNKNIIEKDGQYYFIDNVADYLGKDNYDQYLSNNDMARPDPVAEYLTMTGTSELGDWQNAFEHSGLMNENDYNNYLNDSFINSISQNGINWDSEAINKANHGTFKDQDTMGTTWEADNISRLVKTWEMAQMMGNDNFMDTSSYADYVAPVLPTYSKSLTEPIDYSLYNI